MKKVFIYFLALGFTAVSCNSEDNMSNSNIDDLKAKRDSLKAELHALNTFIEMNDTTKLVSNPIVTASKISVEDFVHKVEVPGTVETDENALITAEASGTIEVVHVKQGQKVSKGQVLVTIDSEILASNIDEVETALELATYMFEKQKKLQEQGVGVEIEYEQAKNQQRSLEQKLKTMRAQKGKTVVRAPFSGVVDDIMVNQGEIAAPQIPLLRIVNNRTIRVNASLSENLLSKVNQGTPVEMVFPSFNDTTITSVVTTRGNYIDPTNRTFKIQIEIKNNELLLPNQFTKVNVTDFSRKDALVIDANAILQDTENNSYVFKLTKDGEVYNVTKTYVNVVKTFKGKSCIEGEVSDGDLIVVKGAKGITEADKVQIQ